MRNRNSKGAVVGYIVIGVVLAAMLVGGVYLVRQAGKSTDSSDDIAKVDDSSSNKTDSSSSDSNKSSSLSETLKQQEEKNQQSKNSEEQNSSDSNSSATNSTNSTDSNSSQSTGGSSQSIGGDLPRTGVEATELPTTGPVEDAFGILAGASLVGLTLAYIKSRRLI